MTSLFHNDIYRGLFGDQTCQNIFCAQAELDRLLSVEIAWVQAKADIGEITADLAEKAIAHIQNQSIVPADLTQGTARDGVPIPTLVRLLKNDAPTEVQQVIHAGLTSQDVMDTALGLALREFAKLTINNMAALISQIDHVRQTQGQNPLMGYTRMQPAILIAADTRLKSWKRPLEAHQAKLEDLTETIAVIQFGGPVGTRSVSDPAAIGAAFARNLGLRDPGTSWHSDRTHLAEFAALLARISGTLGKIGQDVAIMAALGPEQLGLTSGGASSAMPHKNNPVLAELLVTLAHANATQLSNMQVAMVHELERSGTTWALEWMTLSDMAQIAMRGVTACDELMTSVVSVGVQP